MIDSIVECPFEVTEPMLRFIAEVFPDRAPDTWDTEPQMYQAAGRAKVTRWLEAVHAYQTMPKDSQGHPIEPEPLPGEGLLGDLDAL